MASQRHARCFARHPLNCFPLGNAFLDSDALRRRQGLGQLQSLGDERLLQLLRYLDETSLGRLCQCSCLLRGFAGAEELWQPLVLATFLAPAGAGEVTRFRWQGRTWRESFIRHHGCSLAQGTPRIYSDVLYRGFFYAATELKPAWLSAETIQRVDAEVSVADFLERFEKQSCPVIVEGCVKDWPAMTGWSQKTLVQRFGQVPFAAGAPDVPLEMFYDYAQNNTDDVPMFIFDKYFATRAPELLEDYEVPKIFQGRDLFHLLGSTRPDFRWLLIGNRGSGSKWHLDPNKTCAWNAVVTGRKRWLLLPPGCPPPGVHPSKDGAEVTQPLSLLEWFSNFYDELKRHVEANPAWELKEGTCGPGDLMFIPSGWWHCVLNLDDDTIAVTQNYCSETHVSSVRRFLSERRDQVSGLMSAKDRETLAERFDEALSRHRPDLLTVKDPLPKVEATLPVKGFSFWDHLRSTGKSLSFESEEREHKRPRLTAASEQ